MRRCAFECEEIGGLESRTLGQSMYLQLANLYGCWSHRYCEKIRRHTASSAKSVRLVVALAKAGCSLRCSINQSSHASLVSSQVIRTHLGRRTVMTMSVWPI